MMRRIFWCLLIAHCTYGSLVPYGESEGDRYVRHSADNTATVLSVPFVYFEKPQTELFISPNGAVSFGEALPSEIISLRNRDAIAVYYAKTTGGNIYWRVDKGDKTIRELTGKLISAFSDARTFRATEAVLVTFEDMLAENNEGLNIFQLGLLTNGTESYAVLIYSRLDYSTSAGRFAELGFYSASGKTEPLYNTGTSNANEVAKLAIFSEKGVYSYRTTYFPEAGKADMFSSQDDYEYENESEYDSQEEAPQNCPDDSFKDKCPPECNLVPDSRGCRMCICDRRRQTDSQQPQTPVAVPQENQDNSHEHIEPDRLPQQIVPIQSRHQSGGCDPSGPAEGTDTCHAQARCETQNGGNCCKCAEGLYGNGKDCINKTTTLRANGKFEGVISGEPIPSVDLYTHIDTAPGQQHTTIGGLPENLAWSLQLLDPIGNVMAWLFAKVESSDVENGFSITGGVFNRTLNIHLGEKNAITIRQEFLGRENDDALRVNIFVSGTLPTLDAGSVVSFTDFEEKYNREEPGFIRAYADRHITVKQGEQEVQHRVTIDQQIRYKECPFKQVSNRVTVVRVSRITGAYGTPHKTLRFASQGSVYKEEDAKRIAEQNSNPCINSYHVCNLPNMFCKPENGQYRCECEAGYQYLQDDSVEPKFRCVDANECARNPCDRNADCTNTVGSYTCTCRAGFSGDGKQCTREGSEPEADVGFGCRSHSDCHQWGECSFAAVDQPGVCKCRGWYVGDGVNNCGPPEVTYNVEPSYHIDSEPARQHHPVSVESCEKRLNCHSHAQCVATGKPEPMAAQCQCTRGFEGNGTYCFQKDENEQGVRLPTDNKVCTDQSDCHPSAHCVLGTGNTYYCECLAGYRGDGHSSCVKSEECDFTDPNSCGSNGQCRFSSESQAYRCECVHGFTRQGQECVAATQHQPTPHETCDVNPYVCHPEAQCQHDAAQNRHVCVCKGGKQGDGYVRCSEGAPPPAPNEAMCRTCGVNAECVTHAQHGNYSCICRSGFVGNGRECQPIKSCLDDRSMCSENAQCVPDQRGFYVCNCNYGFNGNGHVCNPTKEDTKNPLLIARGMSIIHRSTDSQVPGRQFIVVPHQVVVDIDYDCINERIIWSDIAGYSIRSSANNGTDIKTVYSDDLRSPEGIAVDWTSRNIYYADSIKDEIGVVSIDGNYQKALLTEGLVNPRALVIDLDNRKLYYSDWFRRQPKIGRLGLDGKNNEDFVKDDIELPNGLTLLPNRRELCWVDAGKKQLSCIRLDGTGRRIVYSGLEYPFGLTHENENRFYWTDWKDHKIHSVSVYGDGYQSFLPSVAGQGKIYGILSLNHKCQGKQTECSNNNGGCKYICLPSQYGATCACPDNLSDADC